MSLAPISRATRPLHDSANEGGGRSGELGVLPEWDLSDLYPAMDSPELTGDIERIETECKDFAGRHEGKLGGLTGDALASAVAEYEAIDMTLGRIMSFAGLLYYQNTADPQRAKFMGDTQARITEIMTAAGVDLTPGMVTITEDTDADPNVAIEISVPYSEIALTGFLGPITDAVAGRCSMRKEGV